MLGYHLAHATFYHRFLYSRANHRLFPLRVSQQPCACPLPGTASGARQAVCRAEKKGFSFNLSLNPGGTRRSDSPGPQGQVPPASFPRPRVPPASSPPHQGLLGETAPRAAQPRLSPYLVDVAEEPVGRVAGELGQRPQQLPPAVVQLDGLQQHAGQAEDGGQVQHPIDIHPQPGELHLHHPPQPPPRHPVFPGAKAATRRPVQAEAVVTARRRSPSANAGRREGRFRVRAAAKSRRGLLGRESILPRGAGGKGHRQKNPPQNGLKASSTGAVSPLSSPSPRRRRGGGLRRGKREGRVPSIARSLSRCPPRPGGLRRAAPAQLRARSHLPPAPATGLRTATGGNTLPR